jgi:phosphoglycerate dehydrogenase-like enzyme
VCRFDEELAVPIPKLGSVPDVPSPQVTVGPTPAPFAVEAVEGGGGMVVSLTDDPEALVWLDSHDVGGLTEALTAAPGVRWVQLSSAGVERMTEVIDHTRIWTCAKGAYAQPVAEHALTLALAGLRLLPTRVGARSWGAQGGTSLFGQRVTILGGGGITRSLLELLAPFEVEATVVNRSGNPVPGAARTVAVSELDSTLRDALVVVLALSLTPETRGIIGAHQLGLMEQTAWLVNVARGGHVDTDALVDALGEGTIAGAALDVTDPEPLSDGHALWDLSNAIITPHTADTIEMVLPLLAERIRANVGHFAVGEPLVGLVDAEAGY